MRFIKRLPASGARLPVADPNLNVKCRWLDGLCRQTESRTAEAGSPLVKLPSLSIRFFIRLERFLAHRLWLLLSGLEHALLAAADALVRMQAFQDEFCRGHLLLWAFFLRNAQRTQLVDQALNLP